MVARKIIVTLACLLFSVSAFGSGGKVLVLRSHDLSDTPDAFGLQFEECWRRIKSVGGIKYDVVYMEDSTDVWTKANSGDYGCAIAIGLPQLDADRDTAVELDAVGWWRLENYTDATDDLAFPIPLIMPLSGPLATTGVWAAANTGQIGTTDVGTAYGDDHTVTDAAGHTLFLRTHGGGSACPRIATNDTMSTVYPLIWFDQATTSENQVYCTIWMKTGTGNHKVVYLNTAAYSWHTGPLMAILAAFADFQPVELCFAVENFGYRQAAGHNNTDNLSANLQELADSVLAWDMKLELSTCTVYWAFENPSYGDSMRAKYPFVEGWSVDYPDNFRMTPGDVNDWAAVNYPLSYSSTNRTQAQMEASLARNFDSLSTHGNMIAAFDTTRLVPYNWVSYQTATNPDATDLPECLRAAAVSGVTDFYVMGGVDDNIAPADYKYAMHWSGNYRIRYSDRAASDAAYYNVRIHAWAYPLSNSSASSAILAGDEAGEDYTDEPADGRAVLSAIWLKRMCGFYVAGQDAVTNNDAQKYGLFRPGMKLQPTFLAGDNNILGFLLQVDQQKTMCNYLVTQYGTSGNTEVMKYEWRDRVIEDRKLGRKWYTSHVTRASDASGIWWK